MFWFNFSLLTAFFVSLGDVFSKKVLADTDEYVVSWALRFCTTLFLIPLFLFIQVPELGERFWSALIINSAINLVVSILYMKALKNSDLSITVPMLTFTPLFLLLLRVVSYYSSVMTPPVYNLKLD